MKVNFNQKLKAIDGKENLTGNNGADLTLKEVVMSSLLLPLNDDDEKKKWQKYELYKKIRDAKTVTTDVVAEDIALIKQLVGKHQTALVMGQCWEMLEGD